MHDADDLDLIMPIYNLFEYSFNYSHMTSSSWFDLKDEATNLIIILRMLMNIKSLNYRSNILKGAMAQHAPNQANGILKNATISVPLKYLINS